MADSFPEGGATWIEYSVAIGYPISVVRVAEDRR